MAIVLGYGALLSAALSLLIVASLRLNPRLWLQDAPRAIQDAVPPKTAAEQRTTRMLAVPFLALTLAVPVIAVVHARPPGFLGALAVAYGVLMVFNVVDLVLIDWLLVCAITPRWIVTPGTEHLIAHYKDYGSHARLFVKGCLMLLVISLPLAALGSWIGPLVTSP